MKHEDLLKLDFCPRKFEVTGKISWLWMNSPIHVSWTLDLLSRFILPPIELDQYLLLERDGFPVAYCSWAFLNQKAEVDYMLDPSHISIRDWAGGDRLWFVDWVAPFSNKDSIRMKNELIKKFPHSLARAIRVKREKKNARVMEFKGRELDREKAEIMLDQYYGEFLAHAKQRNLTIKTGR